MGRKRWSSFIFSRASDACNGSFALIWLRLGLSGRSLLRDAAASVEMRRSI
jgi:hypothetical protein